MRVMVIHPGHSHSTADVYTGLCAGLEAHGVEVIGYPLDGALDVTIGLYGLAEEHRPDLVPAFDPYATAAHAIVGRAIWKDVDTVIAVTGQNLHFGAVGTLRKAGILTALVCTESPYLTLERERHDARFYDVVFTNDKAATDLFGRAVHYLPAAYNPQAHTPAGGHAVSPPDVFFVGTGFPERQILINSVDWSGINLKLAGTFFGPLMDNIEAAAYYRSAAISLNHHRTTADYHSGKHIPIDAAYSLGPRAYEIAACGGFQLMDDSRPEAREVFGTALATYRAGDAADLERQVRYWLAHPNERREMAAAQHAAVLPHTWTARAGAVLDVLQEHRTCQPITA